MEQAIAKDSARKAFKIKYASGDYKMVFANNSLEVIKQYDLCTREHIQTRVTELNIVKAVNSHEELIACLKTVLNTFPFQSGQEQPLYKRITTAIAKAEATQ